MIDYIYLKLQNPWWETITAINQDEKLREYDRLHYQYQPKQILNLPIKPKDIHLITGPRQTGKSTALKLYIRQLLQTGFPPQGIMYFSCDALSSEKDIIDLIIEFNKLNQEKRTVIFLDEISSVPNWPAGVKWLADTGLTKKSTFFLTGSSSINLKKSGEYLPGRRGEGKDIALLPVSFYDYLILKGDNIDKIQFNKHANITSLIKYSDKLNNHLKSFLLTGGFLKNINYGLSETINDLFIKTLKSELFKNGKKEDSLREVIRKILNSLSSQTSYTNIAEEAELGSKNTAVDYLNFLVDSFFLKELKFFDIQSQRLVLKKNKKFYSTDPYIIWLFEGFISGSMDYTTFKNMIDTSILVENFIATELVKNHHEFFFFQNSKELDFYLPQKNLGIEVKYKQKITTEDVKSLRYTANKILISKNTLQQLSDVFIIPAHLFPLLEF